MSESDNELCDDQTFEWHEIKVLPPLASSNGVNTPYHYFTFRDYGGFPMNPCPTSIATFSPMEATFSRELTLKNEKSPH